jgi:hypothetical protein
MRASGHVPGPSDTGEAGVAAGELIGAAADVVGRCGGVPPGPSTGTLGVISGRIRLGATP